MSGDGGGGGGGCFGCGIDRLRRYGVLRWWGVGEGLD